MVNMTGEGVSIVGVPEPLEKAMKRIIATAMTLALAAGLASAAEVPSQNIVGYKTMTLNPGYTMLSLNWVEVGTATDEIAINDLFDNAEEAANVTAADAFAQADNIQLWNGSAYVTYYYRYNSAKFKTPAWVKAAANTVATTDTIPLGAGFWYLKRGTDAKALTFAAQVNTAASQQHVFDGGKYTMWGSGFSAEMPLNDARWDWVTDAPVAADAFAQADNIQLWNGSTYVTYYYRYNSAKFKTPAWVKASANTVATTDSIPLGVGAWYLRRGTDGLLADEIKPY